MNFIFLFKKIGNLFSRFFLLSICITFVGCHSKQKVYTIGIDPSWFPLDLRGRGAHFFAFSHDLLEEIARLEKVQFSQVIRSWDNLDDGLKKNQYDAILASIYPHIFEKERYSFSDLYIRTGPVLVVKREEKLGVDTQKTTAEIGVYSKENQALLIGLYPEATIRTYPTLPSLWDSLLKGLINAGGMDYFTAKFYVNDLYKEEIEIMTPPLNEAGLRLITLHAEHQELIEVFNRGLKTARKLGTYDKLLKKWGLD